MFIKNLEIKKEEPTAEEKVETPKTDENADKGGSVEQQDVKPEQTAEKSAAEEKSTQAEKTIAEKATAEKTFTQAELDSIIQSRLGKVYAKLGAKNADEFEQKLNESNSKLAETETKLKQIERDTALKDNHINPDRVKDVDIWFKGTGTEFSASALTEAVKTHPEWVSKVVVPEVGSHTSGTAEADSRRDNESRIAEALGYSKLVG
nr:MAG TPA: Major head protein [Caudoviricetes sp.]